MMRVLAHPIGMCMFCTLQVWWLSVFFAFVATLLGVTVPMVSAAEKEMNEDTLRTAEDAPADAALRRPSAAQASSDMDTAAHRSQPVQMHQLNTPLMPTGWEEA